MNIDINTISLIVIFLIIGWLYCPKFNASKEKFDQFTYTDPSNIPARLQEVSSVNLVDPSAPIWDTSKNKSMFGKLISSNLTNPDINNVLYIDDSNIDFLKSKPINITKPVEIYLTNTIISNYPLKFYFYNSSKANVPIKLIYTNPSSGIVTSNAVCVSNYMTNDINKLKLSLDSTNSLKSSVIIRKGYLQRGMAIYTNNKKKIEWNNIAEEIDDTFPAPADALTVFDAGLGKTVLATINQVRNPAPAPTSR